MFEKILPLLMYGLLLATFVLAAVGLIAILNLALAFFGVETVGLSLLNVGLLALVLGIGASFLQ